jgi:hypothetical protein
MGLMLRGGCCRAAWAMHAIGQAGLKQEQGPACSGAAVVLSMWPGATGLGRAGLPTSADRCSCRCLPCLLPAAIAPPRLPACRKFRNPRLERVQREAVFKRLLDRCKRVRQCPLCGKGGGWAGVLHAIAGSQ